VSYGFVCALHAYTYASNECVYVLSERIKSVAYYVQAVCVRMGSA